MGTKKLQKTKSTARYRPEPVLPSQFDRLIRSCSDKTLEEFFDKLKDKTKLSNAGIGLMVDYSGSHLCTIYKGKLDYALTEAIVTRLANALSVSKGAEVILYNLFAHACSIRAAKESDKNAVTISYAALVHNYKRAVNVRSRTPSGPRFIDVNDVKNRKQVSPLDSDFDPDKGAEAALSDATPPPRPLFTKLSPAALEKNRLASQLKQAAEAGTIEQKVHVEEVETLHDAVRGANSMLHLTPDATVSLTVSTGYKVVEFRIKKRPDETD